MKHLNNYITEYIIKKKLDKPIYSGTPILYTPKNNGELADLIIKLLKDNETNLNCIDVSNIRVMQNLFDYVNNDVIVDDSIDISEWDVSNVIDMTEMFTNCNKFDCDLSKWDVSKVKYMDNMFDSCYNFTGKGLENWDVSNVIYTKYMFNGCENFNCDLSKWDVSKVKNSEFMFSKCEKFDCDLSNWDVSNITDMSFMFDGCSNFTGKNLEKWKLNEYVNIDYMFSECDRMKNKPSWYKE